jgi:hypothetical protein
VYLIHCLLNVDCVLHKMYFISFFSLAILLLAINCNVTITWYTTFFGCVFFLETEEGKIMWKDGMLTFLFCGKMAREDEPNNQQ